MENHSRCQYKLVEHDNIRMHVYTESMLKVVCQNVPKVFLLPSVLSHFAPFSAYRCLNCNCPILSILISKLHQAAHNVYISVLIYVSKFSVPCI